MIQFLLKLLLEQISCCAPRLTLIAKKLLEAKLHSHNVKETESDILARSEPGVGFGNFGKVTSNSAILHTSSSV